MIPVDYSINATLPIITQFSSWLLAQPYLILLVFTIAILFLYKLMKIAIAGTLVAIAGFLFPYFINFLGLPIAIPADTQTAVNFAVMAFALFMIYQFSHFTIFILKLITWPVRMIIRKRQYKSVVRKEVEKIDRKRHKA